MSAPVAKLLVLVGEKFACIKIIGRANFSSSIDFRLLVESLLQKGYRFFVLDLSECVLMDSTFLGVLAGFGLKMNDAAGGQEKGVIELAKANDRVLELLENLGVIHLFRTSEKAPDLPNGAEVHTHAPCKPTREEITSACLEAHRTLMEIDSRNVERFKEVTQFMAEDLKRLKAAKK